MLTIEVTKIICQGTSVQPASTTGELAPSVFGVKLAPLAGLPSFVGTRAPRGTDQLFAADIGKRIPIREIDALCLTLWLRLHEDIAWRTIEGNRCSL